MATARVSVIVPAYNNAPWLPRCLDSLLAQTWRDLEIVVVDDGSTDHTWQVLSDYTRAHPRINAIRQRNRGVTAARLQGVREATGDWIGFMDADDEIEPELYSRLMDNARKYDADIAHCGHQVRFPDGRIQMVHGTGQLRQQDTLTALKDLLDGGQVESSLCTKLFRRTLFDGLEQWMDPNIRNNEDLLMNYHLFSKAERAVYEDVCPYHYILRQGSASYRRLTEHSIFDPIRVRQKILDACDPELRQDARQALLRACLFAYAQLSLRPQAEVEDWLERVELELEGQREYFPLLSRRNRVLANMICAAPWSFRAAYRVYVALFQRQEQH